MTNEELLPKYADGERSCPICSEPLPAHQTWPGARDRFCGKTACAAKFKELGKGKYVEANTVRCEAPGCNSYLPEGQYAKGSVFVACSARCYRKRASRGSIIRVCAMCGIEFRQPSRRKSDPVFCSHKHRGEYITNRLLEQCCGPYRELVDRYFDGYVKLRGMNVAYMRKGIRPFFRFVNESGIASLEEVQPATITDYLAWAEKSGYRNAAHDLTCVSTFFNWMITEGRRIAANPVIPRYHYPPKKKRQPRPYSPDQLNFIWSLLRERGNARLRLAAAIAEEAGLRDGEIRRLRIQDVDVVQQRLFVRLPNKTKCERYAFFSHKTRDYIDAWLQERDPDCGHDFLLYNSQGNPYRWSGLAIDFKRTLCKTFKGKAIHEVGLDNWSIHRLRHTMATKLVSGGADASTVMAQGGWLSFESMAGYAQVDPEVARRSYQDAMRKVAEQKNYVPQTKTFTLTELVAQRRAGAEKQPILGPPERCV